MQPGDRSEFARILVALSAIKPGKPLVEEAFELYFSALLDWPIEEFKAAANHLARSCQFMPNPFDFEQLRRTARPTAAEAWARAVEHAASSAYRDGPLGEEPTDTCVRALGGYVAIARCDEDKLHFLERRFCEHYEAKRDADEVRSVLPALAGPAPFAALAGRGSFTALTVDSDE